MPVKGIGFVLYGFPALADGKNPFTSPGQANTQGKLCLIHYLND